MRTLKRTGERPNINLCLFSMFILENMYYENIYFIDKLPAAGHLEDLGEDTIQTKVKISWSCL